MNKGYFLLLLAVTRCWSADLIEVFQQAMVNEPIYQNALLQTLSNKENTNITQSTLLPNLSFSARPVANNQNNEGAVVNSGLQPPNNVLRDFEMRVTLTQPIFNLANFSRFSASKLSYQASGAHFNIEFQDLILRVSEAYFNILSDENTLKFYRSNKRTLATQLAQVKEKYRLGKTNRNDVDTAQSAFSSADSSYVEAQTQLAQDVQYLSKMTMADYPSFAKLKEKLPLVSPQPLSMEKWVTTAIRQNWNIKSNELKVQAARLKVKQFMSEHLPTVNAEVYYDTQSFHVQNGSFLVAAGSSRQNNATAFLSLNVPIYSGGLTVARVKKAQLSYRMAQQGLHAAVQDTAYAVKQSYLKLVSDIQKLKSDRQAIVAAKSALYGYQEQYKVGAGDLMHVIDQQDKLIRAQKDYNNDQHNYIIELLKLKRAAGTLSVEDLKIVNNWLVHK